MVMIHLRNPNRCSKVRCKVHHNGLGGSRICDSVSGLVFDNGSCGFGVCGGGFARALCIGSCGNMARYIHSCLPLRTMSIFVMFWGFMSKFHKELIEVDLLRLHPTTLHRFVLTNQTQSISKRKNVLVRSVNAISKRRPSYMLIAGLHYVKDD